MNNQTENKNEMGVAGFIIALCALLLFGLLFGWRILLIRSEWAPSLTLLLSILGLITSLIGVFREPRGFAIAGIVISYFVFSIVVFLLIPCCLLFPDAMGYFHEPIGFPDLSFPD